MTVFMIHPKAYLMLRFVFAKFSLYILFICKTEFIKHILPFPSEHEQRSRTILPVRVTETCSSKSKYVLRSIGQYNVWKNICWESLCIVFIHKMSTYCSTKVKLISFQRNNCKFWNVTFYVQFLESIKKLKPTNDLICVWHTYIFNEMWVWNVMSSIRNMYIY